MFKQSTETASPVSDAHAESMSDGRLTSRSTDKDLEGTQDHAVEGPGQTSNGAGAWPLQCEAQFAVPVLESQKKFMCE